MRVKSYKTVTGEISVEKWKAWKAHSNQHLTMWNDQMLLSLSNNKSSRETLSKLQTDKTFP